MQREKIARNLQEQIVEHLRDDIRMGLFPAGKEMREVELAERFGVSRGPVREALQKLAHEGCLEVRPNYGTRVAGPLPEDIRVYFLNLRRSLEVFALRRSFAELGAEDFAAWEEILEQMRAGCRAGDFAAIQRAEFAFHRALVAKGGEPRLLSVWLSTTSPIWQGPPPYCPETMKRPLRLYDEHRALLDAFRGGDVNEAACCLEKHIDLFRDP